MYYKGGSMLHTLRQLVDDDRKWREILRGLNRTFRHQTVTGTQVEEYLARESGLQVDAFFDQYLRTTMVPVLEFRLDGSRLSYRWTDVVPGFDMPVRVTLRPGEYTLIRPTTEWQTVEAGLPDASTFALDPDFYATLRNSDSAAGRRVDSRESVSRRFRG